MSNVHHFGAVGDGRTDDTQAFQHAIAEGDGLLELPRGDYRITRTIEVPLAEHGRFAIHGSGGTARLQMAAPGPALRLVGTHATTAAPLRFDPHVWDHQRMPTISQLEIAGAHERADGIECQGVVQVVFEAVLLRRLRHGIRLYDRCRNVLISHCHVYHNHGAGIFLDEVNLHQINIVGCHISYNRLGGIRVVGSEIRNLQITGNDIEYNNVGSHREMPDEPTAEIYVDATDPGASVAEVTIASNTLQATPSDRGANIRIVGSLDHRHPPGLWTITGNVIGNQQNSVHLTDCRGFSITGNFIYSSEKYNLLAENCRQIILQGNNFRRHTPRLGAGVRFERSQDCVITGCHFADEAEEGQTSGLSLLELVDCARFNINGCQILDGVPYGIELENCDAINLAASTILDRRSARRSAAAVRWRGSGQGNLIAGCTIGPAVEAPLQIDPAAGVTLTGNLVQDA